MSAKVFVDLVKFRNVMLPKFFDFQKTVLYDFLMLSWNFGAFLSIFRRERFMWINIALWKTKRQSPTLTHFWILIFEMVDVHKNIPRNTPKSQGNAWKFTDHSETPETHIVSRKFLKFQLFSLNWPKDFAKVVCGGEGGCYRRIWGNPHPTPPHKQLFLVIFVGGGFVLNIDFGLFFTVLEARKRARVFLRLSFARTCLKCIKNIIFACIFSKKIWFWRVSGALRGSPRQAGKCT